jgi:acetyltransferase EpsM
MKSQDIIIYGAGGHAVPIIDTLLLCGQRPRLIVDDDPAKAGQRLFDIEIRQGNDLPSFLSTGTLIVVAIARNELRRQIVQRLTAAGVPFLGVRHPGSLVSPNAVVDTTVQILPGVIVNAEAVIGPHTILNSGAIVEHGARVGSFVHVGPGAILAGAACIDDNVFIATGAHVAPFVRVGRGSTLGAGGVALGDIPPNRLAVGTPAKVK